MKTYFISDLHFNHKNILKYEPSRVYATAEYIIEHVSNEKSVDDWVNIINKAFKDNDLETIKTFLKYHDDMIVYKWNKKVKNSDTVWFLGDFGMGNKEYLRELVGKLNGEKRMIMGNHDNLPKSFYENAGFKEVIPFRRGGGTVLKQHFILSHIPFRPDKMNQNVPFFFIYGHVHSMTKDKITLAEYHTKTVNSQCVCIERQMFEPIEIEEFNNYVI